jgi:type I restriction enzyme, S subunit
MNADDLLRHFERVADAPEALPRLRQLVLDLAVRGKLLPQQPGDHPQDKALVAARSELSERAKATGRLRFTPSAPIPEADIGDELPTGWVAARVNDTGLYINGLAFKPSDWKASGLPIIRIQNLSDDSREFNYAQGEFADEVLVRTGDILVSWSATLDAYLWKRETGVLNQHIFRVIQATGLTDSGYLLLLLKRAIRDLSESVHAHGLVMTHINRGPFLNHVVWIPPLAEQRRIVAKVDELMALCDRLEVARTEREAARDRLTAASLARLNTPEPETFADDARFALDALSALTARAGQVGQLRQTILNLAVRGRLVARDPTEVPAAKLLQQIAAGKVARMQATGDARIKVAPDPDPADLPMPLPPGWAAQSFENLFLFIDYRGNTPPKTSDGIPLITAKNVRMGYLNREPREFISAATFETWMTRGFPADGDLFFTTEAPLANVCLNDINEPFALAQRVICLQPYGEINTRFLMIALMSDVMQSLIDAHATGLTAKGIKAAKLKPLPMPIPPLVEQQRIVIKVDELMALCDQLETALSARERHRRDLLESLLHEALEPAATSEEVV